MYQAATVFVIKLIFSPLNDAIKSRQLALQFMITMSENYSRPQRQLIKKITAFISPLVNKWSFSCVSERDCFKKDLKMNFLHRAREKYVFLGEKK